MMRFRALTPAPFVPAPRFLMALGLDSVVVIDVVVLVLWRVVLVLRGFIFVVFPGILDAVVVIIVVPCDRGGRFGDGNGTRGTTSRPPDGRRG